MSGKSQTIGNFIVSRPSQILPTNENRKRRNAIIWDLGCSGMNPENRECFYFADASQISTRFTERRSFRSVPSLSNPSKIKMAIFSWHLCFWHGRWPLILLFSDDKIWNARELHRNHRSQGFPQHMKSRQGICIFKGLKSGTLQEQLGQSVFVG